MWLQVGNIVLGMWLLLSPTVLPSTSPGAAIVRIAGPVVIWLGVLSLRSVTRPLRAVNVLAGIFLAIAAWPVPNTGPLILSTVLTGWAIIALSIPRGRVRPHFGGGWWTVIHPELIAHTQEE